MNEKYLLMLLQIINTNGNINKLRRQKLSFKGIAELIDVSVGLNYVSYINEKIALTTSGIEFLTEKQDLIKLKNKEEWIDPDFKNRIKQIDKNDVFLPSQNELSFLNELL